MKPCSHKHVEARIWSRQWKEWCVVAPTYRGQADALICRDCGEWLGVGESDETPVAIEVRAAGLHACAVDGSSRCLRGVQDYCFCFRPDAVLEPAAENDARDLYIEMFNPHSEPQ